MSSLEPIDLLRLNLSLEFALPTPTRLAALSGAERGAVPRVYVSRLPQGYAIHLHEKTPQRLVEALTALGPERLFVDVEAVRELLENDGWSGRPWAGPSVKFFGSHFASRPPSTDPRGIQVDGHRFEICIEGRVVARAWSVRENAHAAELAVHTDPEFRRKGFAGRVGAAWAFEILGEGKAAFYSWKEGNAGSEALARRLNTECFASSVTYL